jgi:hypothetical protein
VFSSSSDGNQPFFQGQHISFTLQFFFSLHRPRHGSKKGVWPGESPGWRNSKINMGCGWPGAIRTGEFLR